MSEQVFVNAEAMQRAVNTLSGVVERFGQKVNTFDEALAATMPWADAWLTRFEAAVARLEAVKEKQ